MLTVNKDICTLNVSLHNWISIAASQQTANVNPLWTDIYVFFTILDFEIRYSNRRGRHRQEHVNCYTKHPSLKFFRFNIGQIKASERQVWQSGLSQILISG